ncbi:MAG TPA: fumarylacetoacetate hydrolase family protein [Steroidobacteraceae bacterium]
MKLATLQGGGVDGKLLVVSRDLSHAVVAAAVAPTLQQVLESWDACEPKLASLYANLNEGRAAGAFPLDPALLGAPLPRAWQWLDASAFHSHGDLMEKVFNLTPPPDKHTRPLMYQGAGDDFLGPATDVPLPSEQDGIDFEAEIGVIVDRVPLGTRAAQAAAHIRLLVLINDWSLRVLAGTDIKTGFGFLQSKSATSFGPVAVTPDELGDAWHDGRVRLPIRVSWNGTEFGHPDCGAMGFSFQQLIEHAARTRNLAAGTVIGSGTISNTDCRQVGSACIAERRGLELLDLGKPRTDYMKFGDRVRIELLDRQQRSIFGAIDQRVVQAKSP